MENKTRQSTGSLFLSIPGLCVLLAILLASFYFKATIISIFILLFLVLCLIAFSWSRKISRQLQADAVFLQECCFPEDEISLNIQLENNGSLGAVWCEVLLPVEYPDLIQPQSGELIDLEMPDPVWSGKAILQKFTWISGEQQLSCTMPLTAKKRGVLQIPYLYLQTGDGFGIGTSRCQNPPKGSCQLVIYPKLYPVHASLLLLKGSTMNLGKRGQYDDVTLLQNIRPYQAGDSFRRINWRMLAKQQEPLVNLYEQNTPESIFFLLDLESFSYQTHRPGGNDQDMMDCIYEQDMELAISIVASCIYALSKQGVLCRLIIPRYAERLPVFFHKNCAQRNIQEILSLLSLITYKGGAVQWPKDILSALTLGMGKTYVITREHPDKKLLAYDCIQNAVSITIQETVDASCHLTLPASRLLNAPIPSVKSTISDSEKEESS